MWTGREISPELRWSAAEEKKRKRDNRSYLKKPSQVRSLEGFFIFLFFVFVSVAAGEEIDKKEIGRRNVAALFSREIDPGSFSYASPKGEDIYGICRKFNMSPELLKEINGLKEGERLPERLKIVPGKFTIIVERAKNTLTLYRDGEFFKEYKVATGRDLSTPLGEYWIASKLISPPWIYEGKIITSEQPEYPLGTRWMGLSGTRLGLHGTKNPEFIGQYISSGCVRMLNEDIEELFKIVPFGTKLKIIE